MFFLLASLAFLEDGDTALADSSGDFEARPEDRSSILIDFC